MALGEQVVGWPGKLARSEVLEAVFQQRAQGRPWRLVQCRCCACVAGSGCQAGSCGSEEERLCVSLSGGWLSLAHFTRGSNDELTPHLLLTNAKFIFDCFLRGEKEEIGKANLYE